MASMMSPITRGLRASWQLRLASRTGAISLNRPVIRVNVSSDQAARPKLILGIESSCDDTGAAVVTSDGVVLGEALATQADIHAQWGGVVPNLAMEAHKAAIDDVVNTALSQAGITADQLDAVAVTVGPGLSLCLRVGTVKAMQLSAAHKLPLVKIHHMEAHALVARMASDPHNRPAFPFLCMLVSGGHNLLVLVKGVGRYVQLGTTLDDAIGEAYDKVARLLGLELKPSGGAALEALAKHGDPLAYKFVVPMRKYANCDFSFAGIKTSVRLAIEANLGDLDAASVSQASSSESSSTEQSQPTEMTQEEKDRIFKVKADIAASFQHVATIHLMERVKRAVVWSREIEPAVSHFVVAGGVACNQHIRSELNQLSQQLDIELVLPPPKWCTDNGAMVAWAGHERLEQGFVEAPFSFQASEAQHELQSSANGISQAHVHHNDAAPSSQSPSTSATPSAAGITDDTWIELRPRWPLTSAKHPRCLTAEATAAKKHSANSAVQQRAAAKYGALSSRKSRMHTSLTDMTEQELAKRQDAMHAAEESDRQGAVPV